MLIVNIGTSQSLLIESLGCLQSATCIVRQYDYLYPCSTYYVFDVTYMTINNF